jgi:VWFA-related protein
MESAKRWLRLLPVLFIALTNSVIGQIEQRPKVDTVSIRTRVVSFQVIVKNKRTGVSVSSLSKDHFEVLDDNKRRTLTYFAAAPDLTQRPLALVLVFDLRPGGAGRYLKEAGPFNSLASALFRLPSGDEVALMATSFKGSGYNDELLLNDFTADRRAIVDQLSKVPTLVSANPVPGDGNLGNLILNISHVIATKRPNSQGVIVFISDGLNIMLESARNESTTRLLHANIALYSLLCHQQDVIKAGIFSLTPLLLAGGLRTHNLEYLADKSGGESLGVHNSDDYRYGLETILGNLAARYSIGFTLPQTEPDDGRFHRLSVRVKGRDDLGRKLTLKVLAPAGYYSPQANEK